MDLGVGWGGVGVGLAHMLSRLACPSQLTLAEHCRELTISLRSMPSVTQPMRMVLSSACRMGAGSTGNE